METIKSPEYLNVRFVVRGIITNQASEVLVICRPDGTWCLPGGKVEPEEVDPLESLNRELFEETGLCSGEYELVKTIEVAISNTLWHNAYYFIKSWHGDVQIQEDEITDYAWINTSQLSNFSFSFGHEKVISDFFTNSSR